MDKPYTFSSIVRLIDFIPIGARENAVVAYINKFIDWCRNNGYNADVKVLEEHLKARRGEDVAMAVMDKAPDEYKKYYGAICDLCAEVDNHKKDCIIQIKDDVEVHTDKIYIENLNGNLYIN